MGCGGGGGGGGDFCRHALATQIAVAVVVQVVALSPTMAADSVAISAADENSSASVEAGWAPPHRRVCASHMCGRGLGSSPCFEVPADLLAEISDGSPVLLSITLATEAPHCPFSVGSLLVGFGLCRV